MVNTILASSVFTERNESHYLFHTHIDDAQYPQVHDFYELVFVISGRMELIVNDLSHMMMAGTIALMRPGDVHIKRDAGDAQHSNLAFPTEIFESIFDFLGQREEMSLLNKCPYVPLVQLSPGEATLLQMRMKQICLLSYDDSITINSKLRVLLLDCMVNHFIPFFQQHKQKALPEWLVMMLAQLDDPANLVQGTKFLCRSSGMSPEHISRSFKKHLGMSPHTYLNAKRLNYAANLLCHSDHSILDIAFEAGFTSESTFFHNFVQEYGVTPKKYRNQKKTF